MRGASVEELAREMITIHSWAMRSRSWRYQGSWLCPTSYWGARRDIPACTAATAKVCLRICGETGAVDAGLGGGMLLRHRPHWQPGDGRWRSRLLQTPQELSPICNTCNQFQLKFSGQVDDRVSHAMVFPLSLTVSHTGP